jgi:hypothetical protein
VAAAAATLSGNLTLSGGTANGVTYLNGSKVLTSGSALTFDGSNIFLFDASASNSQANFRVQTNTTGAVANGYFNINGTDYFRIYGTNSETGLRNLQNTPLFFSTNNTERMRILSSGEVGIGTSSPVQKLSVVSSAGTPASFTSTGTSVVLALTNSGATTYIGNDSTSGSFIIQTPASSFSTKLTVDNTGNLGLGTTSPADTNNFGRSLDIRSSTGAASYFRDSDDASKYALAGFFGADSNAYYGSWGTSTGVLFYSSGSERARIDSSGNLLVGKTASGDTTLGIQIMPSGITYFNRSGSTNADTTLHVYSTGAAAYRFYVGMGGTVYATSTTISAISDIRYKENVRDLDVGLDAVMALKPRLYDWKEGKGADIKNARGFIAQEFEEVFPDLIDEWKDPAPEGEAPYKSVRQDLIPVLVKAIQEQQALIQSLKARLDAANL